MSVQENGQLGRPQPTKVIAVNTTVPEDFEPGFAVVIVVNKAGKVVMDTDWTQLPLVLHMVSAALNTTLGAVQHHLQKAAAEASPIIPPGEFRV